MNEMINVTFKAGEELIGMLAAMAKVFSTGSRGFFGTGKIQLGDKRYQVQVQMVEIGSKPAAPAEKPTKKK